MRRFGVLALPALLLAFPAPMRAQEDTIPKTVDDATLPSAVAVYAAEFYNDPGTIQFVGRTRVPAERAITGDVAVLEGPLVLAGRIDGDVVVINGDLEMQDGATITGRVTVVGGALVGGEGAEVGGEMAVHAAPLEFRRRGERIVVRSGGRDEGLRGIIGIGGRDEEEPRAADAPERRGGRADFILATGNSYNRVEGLPITFGPVFETAGKNPLRLRVMGIYRTEGGGGYQSAERFGFEARLEQFLGGERTFRVGGTLFHKVSPIEDWHLTDLENGLATFFGHRDFRDHYERQGGSVYATFAPPESPLSTRLELRAEHNESLAAGSPWSLFDNNEPWRLQPQVATGSFESLALATTYDTRSDERDPASGWYVQGEVERTLRSSLDAGAAQLAPEEGDAPPGGVILPHRDYGQWTRGFVDVRRYNRISPSSRLNLRLLAGGALTGGTLPPQRQHALGGEGSLPGFSLFSLDCGARDRPVVPGVEDGVGFYPAYGCDRFVLAQAEYRGDVTFRIDLGDFGRDDDEWEDGEVTERDLRADVSWVFFADVGRGWTRDPRFRDERTSGDVGVGLLLGDLGAYVAVPVSEGGSGINFFLRLNNRF